MKKTVKTIISLAVAAGALATTAFAANLATKTIEVATGVDIYLDNAEFAPTDAQGNSVEAMVYNGTTYLPVRAVSEALGNEISWNDEEKRVDIITNTEVADRIALKNLVDRFSVAADYKDTEAQKLMFTEDATVNSYSGDNLISSYKGREDIGTAFANFLDNFDTVFHINGQQTVDLNGDTATGTAYCQVVLIGPNSDGQRVMTTQGVRYTDTYKKVNGEWLISERSSNFMWTDTKVVE